MSENPVSRGGGSEYVYDALVDAGVGVLVGLPGTQTLPLDQTVASRDEITYVMARHETAIPHVAWGYYEASGCVAATLTVPGPGDTNAAHGLKNAYDDNVPILHVSPVADPAEFGNHPIHELEHETFDHVVKANLTVSNPTRLREVVARGVETALSAPYGPVRLGIPSSFLAQPVSAPAAAVTPERTTYDAAPACDAAADLLAGARRPLLYVGGGVRRSADGPDATADLADELDAPVVCSYKGKGAFSEDDDRFLGVTGGDLPAGAVAALEAADVVVALGTDFDGPNTADWSLPMGDALVHVDIDPAETDRGYDADIAVIADVGRACEEVADRLADRAVAPTWDGGRIGSAVRNEYAKQLTKRNLLGQEHPLTTPTVLRAVRETMPSDTVVTTDIGGHRIWIKNAFPVTERREFVTPGSWAGMGVGVPSAIGAKLARPDRPVCTLVGDGCLLMTAQELHTAADEDLDLTAVVFNDADYSVISKSPELDTENGDHRFDWESPDWVAIAEGFGCRARHVETRTDLVTALEWSLDVDGPTLVDVAIDPDEPRAVEVADYDTEIDPTSY